MTHEHPGPSWLRRRVASFAAAARGLGVLAEEAHSRVHMVATLAVIALGCFVGLAPLEWCALVLAMGMVWSAEALNTALERLADAAVPERHPLVGAAKDAAAAAVLLSAMASVAVFLFVFSRHF